MLNLLACYQPEGIYRSMVKSKGMNFFYSFVNMKALSFMICNSIHKHKYNLTNFRTKNVFARIKLILESIAMYIICLSLCKIYIYE